MKAGMQWGEGFVELVEIPSDEEINDNIVLYWTPKEAPQAGDEIVLAYRLHAQGARSTRSPVARTVRTRIGAPAVPGSTETFPEGTRLFVIDFDGGELAGLDPVQPVQLELFASRGRILDATAAHNADGGGWRPSFRLDPEGDEPVDLAVSLALRGTPLTETWTYLWTPDLSER